MDGIVGVVDGGYAMGSRVPVMARSAEGVPVVASRRFSPRWLGARSDCSGEHANLCEKPASGSSNIGVSVGVGVGVPIVILVTVLLWLHRRNVKKQRLEDSVDPHKSLDFGLAMSGAGKGAGGKRKSAFFGGGGEKPNPRNRQISMDMNLSSPYLLPPGLQSSRESLHSLARSLQNNEDPYRPVTNYGGSDVASLRSFKKNGREESSLHTNSTIQGKEAGVPRFPPTPTISVPPKRKASLPTAESSPVESIPPRYEALQAEIVTPPSPLPVKDSYAPAAEPGAVPYPADKPSSPGVAMPTVPEIQEPPAAASRFGTADMPSMPSSPRSPTVPPLAIGRAADPHPVAANDAPSNLQFNFFQDSPAVATASTPQSPPSANDRLSATPEPLKPGQAPPMASSSLAVDDHLGYYEDYQPSRSLAPQDHDDEYEERGRSLHRRQSSEYPQDMQPSGLEVPQQRDQKRLSVGFRPLPPDELIDSEDPETRANRIRSFYKEYFDDSKQQPGQQAQLNAKNPHDHRANHQGAPRQPHQDGYGHDTQAGHAGTQYYDDYDQNYMGDAAYYDPDSNAFVMPYAQPVARRAMTPPPSGSRFPGPRNGPHAMHGSISGMSMPGGRGPPRPGSSVSNNRWGPGPRPGSSASQQWNRPRAGSAMSARSGPRRPLPPPSALSTLPTPSKLRDDSFAIFNAADFAPPSNFKDQAAGRCQSPLGERVAYQAPMAHSPLVSSYDEMAALPSPHLLKKNGTFTGLDFAPPRKFKDADTMSDAGSIRSNRSGRSGLSAMQLGAIKNGAGRVSRLPGDTIFTQAEMATTLKPQWGMRP